MATDHRTADAETDADEARQGIRSLFGSLGRAIFGAAALGSGALALLIAASAGNADSGYLFLILGIGALLVGGRCMWQLPRP